MWLEFLERKQPLLLLALTSIFCYAPDLLSKSQGWIKDTRDYYTWQKSLKKDRIKRSLLSFDYVTNGSQIVFTHGFPIWILLWFFGDAIIEQCNYRNLSYLRRWTGLFYSGHLSTKPHGFVIDMSWTSKVLKGLFGKKVYSFQKCFTYQLSPLESKCI